MTQACASSSVPEGFPEAAAAPCLAITGPTATGKTHLAVELARRFHGEIISVDSRQLYCGLDIGTGKDLAEYTDGGAPVRCHLLDVAAQTERFDLFRYLVLARQAMVEIHRAGRLPILCGGTPLYLVALLRGYAMAGGEPDAKAREELERMPLPDLLALLRSLAPEELLARTDISQKRRVIRAIEIAKAGTGGPPPPPLARATVLAPLYSRAEVRERIRLRLDERLAHGLIEEVQALHDTHGLSWEQLEWLGLEYRFVSRYLRKLLSFDAMREELLNHIRQFAKRQDIWFRRLEREGLCIHWIPNGDMEEASRLVQEALRDYSSAQGDHISHSCCL